MDDPLSATSETISSGERSYGTMDTFLFFFDWFFADCCVVGTFLMGELGCGLCFCTEIGVVEACIDQGPINEELLSSMNSSGRCSNRAIEGILISVAI